MAAVWAEAEAVGSRTSSVLSTARAVKAALRAAADPEKAEFYPRFFRTGKGEYGEGDRFLGVTVPKQRRLAKQARDLAHGQVEVLLADPYHECRLTGLLILVDQYAKGDSAEQEAAAALYLDNLHRVNNWDLVDSSAHKILGAHLRDRDRSLLYELARSGELWRQRIAMIATLQYIREGDFKDTLALADILLHHEHDLIHKAVGWMIREVGKMDQATMEAFLATRYQSMPRTMLRYAIEKLPPERRKSYLDGHV